MPTNPTHQKTQTTPKLRFPGFSDGWEEKKIGNILKIGSGRDYKHLKKGNIPVYGTGGYMISVDEFLYDGESVCIGRKGTINKPRIIDGKFWTVDTLFYTHSFISSIPKFVYLLFQNINWIKYNEASGVPSLSKATIEKIKLNLPQLPEQNKIATFLTTVDEKIEKIREKKKILEEYKKGVMQKIFSQEVRFPGFEGVWDEKRLGEIFDVKSGNSKSSHINKNGENIIVDMGAIGRSGNLIGNKKTDYDDDYLTVNDLVMAKDDIGGGNIIGKVVQILKNQKYILGDHVYKLSLINGIIKYLYYAINSYDVNKSFRQKANGTAQIGINNGTVNNQKILFPSLPEQEKIADFLSAIDEKIEKVGEELGNAVERKKGLLQGLFV